MKKIIGLLLINFFIFSGSSKAGPWGEGELQLTDGVAQYFIQFIKGKGRKKPADFYVTLDGTDAMYWYCGEGNCKPGSASQDIKICESNFCCRY